MTDEQPMTDKQIILVHRRDGVAHDDFLAGVLEHAALLAEHRADVRAVAVDEVLADQSPLAAVGMTVRDVTHHAVLRVWTEGTPSWHLPHSEQLVADRLLAVGDAAVGWRVDERVAWDYDRDWPDGARTPGVKQISLVAALPSLPLEQFRARYHAHADVARVHHIGVWRYVQNIVTAPALAGSPAGVHGLSELWFRHLDDMLERMYTGPDSPAAVYADTSGFIDFPNTRSFLVAEHCAHTG
jgi:hypothetical protein